MRDLPYFPTAKQTESSDDLSRSHLGNRGLARSLAHALSLRRERSGYMALGERRNSRRRGETRCVSWSWSRPAIAWVKRCPNPMLEVSDIEIRQFYELEDFAAVVE